MNNRIVFIAFVFGLLLITACKSKPKPVSGEIQYTGMQEAYSDSVDSAAQTWGEPAPPPAVQGDGRTLFQERYKAVNNEYEEDFNIEGQQQSSGNSNSKYPDSPEDYYYASSPSYNRPATSSYYVNDNPDYVSEFDYSDEPNAGKGQESGAELLPYAANQQEKLTFVKDFFQDFFANNCERVAESDLSLPCKSFLREKGEEIGEQNMAYFFRTEKAVNANRPSDAAKTLNFKPIGDDWFRVTMNEGHGNKYLDVKVVEYSGKLMIDMVRNKNL